MKRIYDDSSIPDWAEIISETDNFILVQLNSGLLYLDRVEALLGIGLKLCAITAAGDQAMIVCCEKV